MVKMKVRSINIFIQLSFVFCSLIEWPAEKALRPDTKKGIEEKHEGWWNITLLREMWNIKYEISNIRYVKQTPCCILFYFIIFKGI